MARAELRVRQSVWPGSLAAITFFPACGASLPVPLGQYQIILLVQGHCAAVPGQELNPQSLGHKSDTEPIVTPRHLKNRCKIHFSICVQLLSEWQVEWMLIDWLNYPARYCCCALLLFCRSMTWRDQYLVAYSGFCSNPVIAIQMLLLLLWVAGCFYLAWNYV